MKCKPKDCKDCVHNIDIRTHPLFRDFVIQSEDGKILDFQGCIFHFQTMLLRQIWVRTIGTQAAVESHRNVVGHAMNNLALEVSRMTKTGLELNERKEHGEQGIERIGQVENREPAIEISQS